MKLALIALNASYPHTNLALRQIRSRVPGDWECALFERHINLPRSALLRDILRLEADCAGFSCYLWNRDLCMKLAAALKRARPRTFVYFGGPEAEHDPEPFLSCGDAVSRGEGEGTIEALLRGVETGDLRSVPGLVTRDFANPVAAPLPPESWPDAYPRTDGLQNRIVYVETSRGCPYRCGYCLSAGEKVRALPADEAARRLTALAEGGVKLIKLVDRTFNFDRGRAAEIWETLVDHYQAYFGGTARSDATTRIDLSESAGPRYHFEIAANLLDERGLNALARAPKGLFQLEAGIQSTNEEALRAVGQTASTEDIFRNLKKVIALQNIPVHVDLIAGLPYEGMESFARSFDQTWALGADMLQLGFLKLLPGSRLRREAEKYGIVYDPAPPYEVLRTPWLSCDDLCLLHDVESVMDWYDARCPRAMRRLSLEEGPFAARLALAEELRSAGAFDRDLTEKNRLAALLALRPHLRHWMAHDLLLQGRPLPPELEVAEDEALRALLRACFHPIRGQRARRYPFDPRLSPDAGSAPGGEIVLIYHAGRCFDAGSIHETESEK